MLSIRQMLESTDVAFRRFGSCSARLLCYARAANQYEGYAYNRGRGTIHMLLSVLLA